MGSCSDAGGSAGNIGCLSRTVQEEMEAKEVRKGEDQSSEYLVYHKDKQQQQQHQ